jgi:hypothetical protein
MDDAALYLDKAADSRENPISPSDERALIGGSGWTRISIARIEDLSDAVLGAGLTAQSSSRHSCAIVGACQGRPDASLRLPAEDC